MTTAKDAARAAQGSSVFRTIARVGFVVLGVVHVVIGAIAISIAMGGGGEADHGGVMQQIRQTPAGVILLWGMVVGLVGLAAWQIAESALEKDPDSKKRWARRAKLLGTAFAYLAIAGTALVYALGGSSDSSSSSQTFSAGVMATPGGVIMLTLVGSIVVVVGIAFIVRGVRRRFEKRLDLPTGPAREGIVLLGVIGYVAKGIAVAVTGVLFVVAALTHDPQTAGGLDAALHALAGLPLGAAVLWVVGAGLVVYGVFCVVRARLTRM